MQGSLYRKNDSILSPENFPNSAENSLPNPTTSKFQISTANKQGLPSKIVKIQMGVIILNSSYFLQLAIYFHLKVN